MACFRGRVEPVVAAAELNGGDVGHPNSADDAGRGRPRPRRSGRRQGLVLLPRHGGDLIQDEDIVSDFDLDLIIGGPIRMTSALVGYPNSAENLYYLIELGGGTGGSTIPKFCRRKMHMVPNKTKPY